MQRNPRYDLLTIILAYLAFIGLGMQAGLLGLVWLSIQATFDTPLAAQGVLMFATTFGYLTASFFSGAMAFRFGIARMLVIGAAALTLGTLGAAVTPTWLLLIGVLLITGIGSGMIDAGLNAYLAQHHSERAMNWLHASFGIGVTLMPIVMGIIFGIGQAGRIENSISAALMPIMTQYSFVVDQTWRIGYVVVALFFIAATALFLFTSGWWRSVVPQTSDNTPAQRGSMRDTLRIPIVWLSIIMFVVLAGLEATPGNWGFTYFTIGRQIDAVVASQWVALYWGSFTIGRIFFGAIISRVNTRILMRVCLFGAFAGALLLWLNPVDWVGFAGLGLLGFMQAPLFPVMISNTPRRVGTLNAPNAIGFQIAGAGIGVAAIPALGGALMQVLGVDTLLPYIVVAAALLIMLHELTIRQRAHAETAAASSAL